MTNLILAVELAAALYAAMIIWQVGTCADERTPRSAEAQLGVPHTTIERRERVQPGPAERSDAMLRREARFSQFPFTSGACRAHADDRARLAATWAAIDNRPARSRGHEPQRDGIVTAAGLREELTLAVFPVRRFQRNRRDAGTNGPDRRVLWLNAGKGWSG